MKTTLSLFAGLVLLSLYRPIYAQTAPGQSGQQPQGKNAGKAVHKTAATAAHNPGTYDGPVVMNTQELGKKIRAHSRPSDNIKMKVMPRKLD